MFAKIRKILLVVAITALIWVWADQALTRYLDNVPAMLHVDKTTDSHLLVSFDKQQDLGIKLKISGPSGKVDSLEKKLRERGTLGLDFYFNPADKNMAQPGQKYTLPLLDLVKNNRIIQDYGVEIEDTVPATVDVEVVKLVKSKLPVQVFNENHVLLNNATVKPAMIEMLVRQDIAGSTLNAAVTLTSQEVQQAHVQPVQRRPVVEISGVSKQADEMISISLPSADAQLIDYNINETNIGIVFSPNTQGLYKVELTNKDKIFGALKIRATPQARDAFVNSNYKMYIEITDDDAKVSGEIDKLVIPNFPDEYVRKNEIILNEPGPREAKFKLVPLSPPAEKAAPAPTSTAADLK